MAHSYGHHWDDDKYYSSGRDSDDSPILSYRYDKSRRYAPYVEKNKTEERERKSTFSVLAKFFFFCSAMILFCVLLYIPVYNKVNEIPKGVVAGWSMNTNRDTKIYVRPYNVTTIHEPKDICSKQNKNDKNNLFLLIIVCSSTSNFDRRIAIRETWGNPTKYIHMSKTFNSVREKYSKYNFTYDLYPKSNPIPDATDRMKRNAAGFGKLLPELAKALQNNLNNVKTEDVPEEPRFEEDGKLPEFDMNEQIGDQSEKFSYDYDYESNIMKIPPNGFEDGQDLGKILNMLKKSKSFPETATNKGSTEVDYKVVFLLGLPAQANNDTDVQGKIEEEVQKYGDVIQEGFVDSYNNLTLKSIMMLKWITNKCDTNVRYILKTDDDMYINVPNLMLNLRNRSKAYDGKVSQGYTGSEYLLIGDLICGARPVLDSTNKWFSPRYMYGGRVYPRYLSGTGYVMSAPTAHALYHAALKTTYFHLEDIYITGMCAVRASPRQSPRDDAGFTYQVSRVQDACCTHAHLTAHHVTPAYMHHLHSQLAVYDFVDKCERIRLTQMKEQQHRLYVLYKYLRLLVTSEC